MVLINYLNNWRDSHECKKKSKAYSNRHRDGKEVIRRGEEDI
jgi:hypothetical protein